MHNTRISFGTIFPASELSPLPTTLPNSKNPESNDSYKQKYLDCKENVRQFMLMVEKEFEKLVKKHNDQKQQLKQEIARLKRELEDRNDVSSFTVRSKRVNGTNTKSQRGRSVEQDNNHFGNTINFEGISAFDQSKIHSRAKSIIDKNLSSISHPNTLLDLENALNSKNSSRISSQTGSVANQSALNNTQNNSSSNVTQYTNQILGKRNKRLEESQKKQNFDALMEKMIEKNIFSQAKKQKSRLLDKTQAQIPSQQSRLQQRNQSNKQNLSGEITNRTDSKSKSQENSVRNLLKNLRSSMKNNIEKESNLQATTLSSSKI